MTASGTRDSILPLSISCGLLRGRRFQATEYKLREAGRRNVCILLTHSSQKGRERAPQCSTGSSESFAAVLHKFPRLRPECVYDSLNASYTSRARGILSSHGNSPCVGGEVIKNYANNRDKIVKYFASTAEYHAANLGNK